MIFFSFWFVIRESQAVLLCRSKLNGRIYFAWRFFRVFDRGQSNCFTLILRSKTRICRKFFLRHRLVLTGTTQHFLSPQRSTAQWNQQHPPSNTIECLRKRKYPAGTPGFGDYPLQISNFRLKLTDFGYIQYISVCANTLQLRWGIGKKCPRHIGNRHSFGPHCLCRQNTK